MELASIERVLGMSAGYVLDFSNRTFAMFFADLGVDIDALYPEGSKANRLRAFLRSAEPTLAGRVLDALFAHRGDSDGDDTSPDIPRYQNVIARLAGARVVPLSPAAVDVLTLDYARELEVKTDQRLKASDFEGAITTARTTLEAVLMELERKLLGSATDHRGDLQRMYKSVAKQLGIDDDRADLADYFRQVVRGLVQVVNGLAPIRNKMSDGHPRERKPAAHHARVVVNAARTVATFLIESYLFQRDRGTLPDNRPQD